jgi:hypothetical protein
VSEVKIIAAPRDCSECPSPYALGEYGLRLLYGGRRATVLRHVLLCSPCARELSVLRSFLWAEAPAAPPAEARTPSAADRIVAAALGAIATITSIVPRRAPAIAPR